MVFVRSFVFAESHVTIDPEDGTIDAQFRADAGEQFLQLRCRCVHECFGSANIILIVGLTIGVEPLLRIVRPQIDQKLQRLLGKPLKAILVAPVFSRWQFAKT